MNTLPYHCVQPPSRLPFLTFASRVSDRAHDLRTSAIAEWSAEAEKGLTARWQLSSTVGGKAAKLHAIEDVLQQRSTSESCTIHARKRMIRRATPLRKEQPQMQAPSMMLLVPSAQLSSSTAVAPFETHSGFRCISCGSKALSPTCRCPQRSTHH